MGITLYYMSPSPPSRAVDFLIKELELDAELKQVNLLEKDQLKPEFLALNPTHTIPTLDDNGFVVWDSHAILQYLASKYGKDSTLYPKDPENQATVNNRLFFNATTFFPRMRDYAAPVFWGRSDTFSADQRKLVQESLKWLDGFIESSGGFVAGPTLTIADFAVAASISSVDQMKGTIHDFELDSYPNIHQWLEKCKKLKNYDECLDKGAKVWFQLFSKKSEGKEIK